MSVKQRELFEAAVVDRLKESGFLEIEIRTEALVRVDDGYQDEVINAGWYYWNAALSANEIDFCPVCAEILNDDDMCATDIELGICHAACLEGSPVVDIDTGAPLPDGELATYRFGDDATRAPPAPETMAGRWLPIALADTTITNVEDFSEVGITLRTSDRYWVRDDDGRVYEAAWSEGGDGGRDYWWDFEGESPVDPVEFMPHPLDPIYAAPEADHGN